MAKNEPAMKKGEAAKKAVVVAKKAGTPRRPSPPRRLPPWRRRREPKAPAADDVLAPPPGTTITKIAKVEPKKNGIRDMNIALFGLRDKAIKQVMINCQTASGPVGWRLDTSDSQDWPVVIERSGVEPTADIFLEPPPGDCFEKDFTININYEDGQAGNVNTKATLAHRCQACGRPEGAERHPAGRVGLPDRRRDALRQARRESARKRCDSRRRGKTRSRCRFRGWPACTSACSIARSRSRRFASG